jgi:hypothetical protein
MKKFKKNATSVWAVTLGLLLVRLTPGWCEEPISNDPIKVGFGGFVDTYYAYDSNNPWDRDRPIFTQAKRNNEFNINLAYLDAKVNSDRVRGRFALQTGTSVQANYFSEPSVGAVSGFSLSRMIQEAVAGYRVTDRLWIDAGIYSAPLGSESFISRDNWNYTRSLDADLSPYYQSGVRAIYQWSDAVSTQFHITNGWGNFSENNDNKAFEFQFAYVPRPDFSLTYNGFFGNEVTDVLRTYNQVIVKTALSGVFQVLLTCSIGTQGKKDYSGTYTWQSANILGYYQLSKKVSLGLRTEYYSDKNQIIVTTFTPNGFRAWGGSVNLDVLPVSNLLWRTEFRQLWTQDDIFTTSDPLHLSSHDSLIVTSIALSFQK